MKSRPVTHPGTGVESVVLVVDENPVSQDDLEPRTKRAVAEAMDVSLLSKGGLYEVQSASGNQYNQQVGEPALSS